MTQWLSNPIRHLIVAVLTVSMPLCCWQSHVLFAADDAEPSSCCTSCAVEEGPGERPADAAPVQGCQSCCLKATGPKDGGLDLDGASVITMVPLLAVSVGALRFVPDAGPMVPGPDRAVHVAPPTLLRLACALRV